MNRQSPLYIIFFILILSLVFGFGISFVNYVTLPMLKKNEALHKNRVIAQAFMLESDTESLESIVKTNIEETILDTGSKKIPLFKNIKSGETGLIFTGTGFWDKISGLIVLSPDLNRVINIKFIEQKETPGLGARIEEVSFTNSFKGLTVLWESSPDKRIIIGSSPDAEAKNRIDAITGATQTSIALMQMINNDLETFRNAYIAKKGE